MNDNQATTTSSRYRTRRITRRATLALLAGTSLAGTRVLRALGQDAAAPATPTLGEQADGTVTWRVQAGHMDMAQGIDAMAFFPGEITINAGDRIFFDIHGLHTVSFLSGGEQPPFIVVPEAAALGTPAAPDDATRWALNPAVGFPSGPLVHDGASYLNSGIPDPTMPPVVVEFTEAGTFEYLCLVHPSVMKATVIVQEQGAERPMDQAAYDQKAAEEMDAVMAQGQALIEQHGAAAQATPAADGSTVWDVVAGVGEDQAQVMRFLPDRLEIAVGDTVRWTNMGGPEPHTVTFPGENPPPEFILVEPGPAGPPLLVLNPEIMEPAGEGTYIPASFANSGWLQQEPVEFPEGVTFPHTWELTFDQPGEYQYYCALHAGPGGPDDPALVGMVGTIVVS